MAFAAKKLKLLVEPGGAAGLAALLAGKLDVKGKTVAVVLSGGNGDPATFARLLRNSGPNKRRPRRALFQFVLSACRWPARRYAAGLAPVGRCRADVYRVPRRL